MVFNQHCISADHQKKNPVARVAAALPVPDPPESEELQEGIGKSAHFHTPKLTVRQRKVV